MTVDAIALLGHFCSLCVTLFKSDQVLEVVHHLAIVHVADTASVFDEPSSLLEIQQFLNVLHFFAIVVVVTMILVGVLMTFFVNFEVYFGPVAAVTTLLVGVLMAFFVNV